MKTIKPSELFLAVERVVEQHGARVAVLEDGVSTSHAALLGHARNIAHTLAERGRASPFVAVLMEPGCAYIASILAVTSLDKGFCPIEHDAPPARMLRMLVQVRPSVIVTQARHVQMIQAAIEQACGELDHTHLLLIEGDVNGLTAVWHSPGSLTAYPSAPTQAGLYLLFTSGSTGEPKGIVGSTSGLLHFTRWEAQEFGLDERVVVPLLAPISFDVSLRDIFTPLLSGGSVCVVAPDVRRDPVRLLGVLERAGCTLMHCVPSLLRLLLEVVAQDRGRAAQLRGVAHILLAGEPLYGKDVNLWRERVGDQAELVNLYGPSETTLAKLFHRVSRDHQDPGVVLPLGKPLPSTAVRVMGDDGMEVAANEVGEIVIETPFTSLGYLGLPQENAERFLHDPITGLPVGFRTGDLGHRCGDGLLCFDGRRDHQVKIRGNRVELSEVESCLMGCAGVEQAVVIAVPVAEHDLSLVGFYRGLPAGEPQDIQRHLENELPGYMRPSRLLRVQGFELNANGKIDRKALIRLASQSHADEDAATSLTAIQAEVVAMFRAVLGQQNLGLDEHFFASGGSSLSGIAATSRLSSAQGISLGLADLLKAPTARGLSAVIETRKTQPDASAVTLRCTGGRVPATPYQKMFWDFCQYKESKLAYNEPVVFEIDGSLDVEACRRVLEALIERHEGLRTGFRMIDGQLFQEIMPSMPLDAVMEVLDLRSSDHSLEEAEASMRQADGRPFDLAKPPLFRCRLYLLGQGRALVHLLFAHVMVDDHSLHLLMNEAHALYRCFVTDEPDCLAPPFSGCRVAPAAPSDDWQNYVASWQDIVSGPDRRLNLPMAAKRPLIKTFSGDQISFHVPDVRSLRALAVRGRCSLFACLLTGVAEMLGRAAHTPELVLGVPMAARSFFGADRTVGNFLNTLPLLVDARPHAHFPDRMVRAQHMLMAAQCHSDVPLTALTQRLSLPTDFSRSVLFDASVTLTENALQWAGLGLNVRRLPWHNRRSKLDLLFLFNDDGGELTGTLEFNTRLFAKEDMQGLIDSLQTILREQAVISVEETRP